MISIDIQSQLKSLVNELHNKLSNLKDLNEKIGQKGLSEINKQFSSDGSEFNTPWRELAPITIELRRKGKKKGSPKILRDTGLLKESFVYAATEKEVRIGTPVKYSAEHQGEPGIENSGRVPKRPILPEDPELAYEKIAKPAVTWFTEKLIKSLNKKR